MNKYVRERKEFEKAQIISAMLECDLNVLQSAKLLQWSRGNLMMKLKKHWGRNYRHKILMKLGKLAND